MRWRVQTFLLVDGESILLFPHTQGRVLVHSQQCLGASMHVYALVSTLEANKGWQHNKRPADRCACFLCILSFFYHPSLALQSCFDTIVRTMLPRSTCMSPTRGMGALFPTELYKNRSMRSGGVPGDLLTTALALASTIAYLFYATHR